MLEFALILPILLIVVAGLLDVGRLYYVYIAVTDAAAEGASYAAINPTDTQGITERAQSASSGVLVGEDMTVEVIPPNPIEAGAPIAVTVSYPFKLATPLINIIVPEGVLTLSAVATEVILTGEMGG